MGTDINYHMKENLAPKIIYWFCQSTQSPIVYTLRNFESWFCQAGVVSLGKALYSMFPHSTQVQNGYQWYSAGEVNLRQTSVLSRG